MEIFKWHERGGIICAYRLTNRLENHESRFPDLHQHFCRMPAEKVVLHDNGCPLVGYHVKSIVAL